MENKRLNPFKKFWRNNFGRSTPNERFLTYTVAGLVGLAAFCKGVDAYGEKQAERREFLESQRSGIEQTVQGETLPGYMRIPTMQSVDPERWNALQNSSTNPNMPYMDADLTDEFGGDEKAAHKGLIYDKSTKSWNSPIININTDTNPIPQPKKQEGNSHANRPGVKLYANSKNETDNVISNEFFRNSNYINEAQIRTILVDNNSCLQNTGIEKTIVQAAQKHDVNPLYILARLQQEKGLVTKQKATKRDLKYATGYGSLDTGKKLPSGGLYSQVKNTAERLNELANEYDGTQTVTIDYGKRTVSPDSAVKYALLCYTPHSDGLKLTEKVVASLKRQASN
jgi:hypothetical protein